MANPIPNVNPTIDFMEKSPTDRRIHDLFEIAAARTPEMPAVLCRDATLTYGDLNRRANQFARRLSGRGVRANQMVGILMPRSVDIIVALLGVLKCGGAYVPMDLSWPRDRVELWRSDTRTGRI